MLAFYALLVPIGALLTAGLLLQARRRRALRPIHWFLAVAGNVLLSLLPLYLIAIPIRLPGSLTCGRAATAVAEKVPADDNTPRTRKIVHDCHDAGHLHQQLGWVSFGLGTLCLLTLASGARREA